MLLGVAASLACLAGLLSGGVGGVLITAGIAALVGGPYAVIVGRNRLFRLRGRLAGAILLLGALVTTGVGSAAYGAAHPEALKRRLHPHPSTPTKPAPTPAQAAPVAAPTITTVDRPTPGSSARPSSV
jgi:hypothetical protein